VLLENGSRQEIDRRTGRLNMLTFQQNELDLSDASKENSLRQPDMAEAPLLALLNPNIANSRDVSKWKAEGHRRLSAPLTAISYAFVALYSVLSGVFRRQGGFVRPFATILVMVALLALGLAFGNLANRDSAMLPLVWIHALAPGLICGWLLLGPQLFAGRPPRIDTSGTNSMARPAE
jgi:lipopolysaccharide export system permease protein